MSPKLIGCLATNLESRNTLVITQHAGFGPQVNSIDGTPIAKAEAEFDLSVYEVTKTIRIPLDQPELQPGQMPQYTVDVAFGMRE